jgi:hypothetical protein
MSRLLLLVEFHKNTPERLKRVAGITEYIEQISKKETEFLFKTDDLRTFARMLKTDKSAREITMHLSNPGNGLPLLLNEDAALVIEIGDDFSGQGFSRTWTWLQRH